MGKEGSVAPKERVNIVYRPATGDAKEEVELPLKLLVMGDFTMREHDESIEDRKAISVDKDNFNDVLKAQKLSLDLNVANKMEEGKENENLAINVKFDSIKDFEPDAIVEKVPEFQSLVGLRDALKALKGPLGNVPEFRKQLQELVKDETTRGKLLGELGLDEQDK